MRVVFVLKVGLDFTKDDEKSIRSSSCIWSGASYCMEAVKQAQVVGEIKGKKRISPLPLGTWRTCRCAPNSAQGARRRSSS